MMVSIFLWRYVYPQSASRQPHRGMPSHFVHLLGIILAFVLEISYYIYCFYQKSTE
jgi:hypothetical protein